MPDFVSDDKLEQMFREAIAPLDEPKPTASLVVVNQGQNTDSVGTMVVDDVGTPSASKTILVGREIGTGRVCKITVEYPEEEKSNG